MESWGIDSIQYHTMKTKAFEISLFVTFCQKSLMWNVSFVWLAMHRNIVTCVYNVFFNLLAFLFTFLKWGAMVSIWLDLCSVHMSLTVSLIDLKVLFFQINSFCEEKRYEQFPRKTKWIDIKKWKQIVKGRFLLFLLREPQGGEIN